MEKMDNKPKKIVPTPVSKKGKHPFVNFEPTDTSEPKKTKLGEAQGDKNAVVAVSTRTGRKIKRRFRDHEQAYSHFRKWLQRKGVKNVQLADSYLNNKALEFDIDPDLLAEIYARGEDEWNVRRPENFTSQQWAIARVNSFIQGGRALDEDAFLLDEGKKYRIGKKTPNKALGKLAKRNDEIGEAARAEQKARASQTMPRDKAQNRLTSALQGKAKVGRSEALKIMGALNIHHRSGHGKALLKAAESHDKKRMEAKLAKKVSKAAPVQPAPASPSISPRESRPLLSPEAHAARVMAVARKHPNPGNPSHVKPDTSSTAKPVVKKTSLVHKASQWIRQRFAEDYLNEGKNYHSVFYNHEGKWQHHGDYDTKEDAQEERSSLRNDGEKTIRLVVPKKEANWTKVDPHEYVSNRLKKPVRIDKNGQHNMFGEAYPNDTQFDDQEDSNRDRGAPKSNTEFQKTFQRRNKKHSRPAVNNAIKPAKTSSFTEAVASYTKPTTKKPKLKTLTTDMDKEKAKFKMERHRQKLHGRINKMRETCANKLSKYFKSKGQ